MKHSRFAHVIGAILFSICWPRLSNAGEVTLAWDPPSDGNAAGYVLYYGTGSREYTQQVDVGNATEYTVNGLNGGTTYYFALRTYNATGMVSDLSNEVDAEAALSSMVTGVALTSSLPSPQVVGTSVTFLATATGGVAPYEFQWGSSSQGGESNTWLWTSSSTFTLTPSTAGDYQVSVAVRSSGSSSSTGDVTRSMPFTVTAPRVGSVTLLASAASPQLVGSTIVWSAAASGGVAPYQYRWWVYDGKVWSAATAWTTSSTWAWTPTTANREYIIRVWARSAGQTSDAPEASALIPFAIESAPTQPGSGAKGRGPTKCQGSKCK